MEILDLAVSLRDSLPNSGRSCQHTVWWCGYGGVDVGVYVGGWMWGGWMWGVDVGVDVGGGYGWGVCGCVGVEVQVCV